MFGTQEKLIEVLRSMAREGSSPSSLLRTIMAQHPTDGSDRNLLVQYFTEAFCFQDAQAYPIFGWLPDESGELKDANINTLLAIRIEKTRADWIEQK